MNHARAFLPSTEGWEAELTQRICAGRRLAQWGPSRWDFGNILSQKSHLVTRQIDLNWSVRGVPQLPLDLEILQIMCTASESRLNVQLDTL